MLNRRWFLTGLGSVVALPAAAVEAVGKAIFTEPVSGVAIKEAYSEFGWIDKPEGSFTEIITTTVRSHKQMIMDNLSQHNALYHRMLRDDIKKSIYELQHEENGETIESA